MWGKVLIGLVGMAIGVCMYGIPSVPDVDSASYLAMADGRMAEVVRPYANRVLHPLVVRWTGGSFEAVAAVSLVVALILLAGLLRLNSDLAKARKKDGARHEEAIGGACLVCAPFFCSYLVEIYLADLLVMALTAMFFLCLYKEYWVWTLLLLFLMQTARESTVVVALALITVALWRHRWCFAGCVLGVLMCAMATVSFLSRESPGNIHAMSGFVYIGAKVFSNGLANLLGVTVWSDIYARVLPHFYPEAPLWQTVVPMWLPLGGIKAVGVYAVDGWRPVEVFVILASAFGILPTVLLKWLKPRIGMIRGQSFDAEKMPNAVVVAGLTGFVFFLLAPFSGRSVLRLVGYAWPLFWFALPWLIQRGNRLNNNTLSAGGERSVVKNALFGQKKIWVLHLVCMWWPVLLVRMQMPREMVCLLGLAGVIACHFVTSFRLLAVTEQEC